MKAIGFVAMLVLFGCTKDKAEPDKAQPAATGATATVSCADAITKAYDRLPSNNPQMAGVVVKLKEVMIGRCTEDKWPQSVLDCYTNATTQPTMKACRDGLPPELKAKASAEIVKIMSGAGGPGGGGGMPHGGAAPAPAGSGS